MLSLLAYVGRIVLLVLGIAFAAIWMFAPYVWRRGAK